MTMKRSSGILMAVSSLPSPYGIGTLGKAAYEFADFLHDAGQHYWQMLPLGPTSYGDSPYQSFSTFAGNPYFIDLDMLIDDGLLKKSEVAKCQWGTEPRYVDYGKIYESRFQVLALAKQRGWRRDAEQVAAFREENGRWLEDYALYMACKRHFGMKPWQEWPDEAVRLHEPAALARYRELLREDVELFTYIQFLFFRQWTALKSYINSLGMGIIGDLPIYVAMDSTDVWAERSMFRLDSRGIPTEVAGVPPDYFSKDGQLWGNPLYNWTEHKKTGYAWWISRIRQQLQLVDYLRIDHFRGFEAYWSVPYGDETAINGKWIKGPGASLFRAIEKELGKDLPIFAEDLGVITPQVEKLRDTFHFPGMKVLQFAFNDTAESDFLPYLYPENCICYTGTHDNDTTVGWYLELDEKYRDKVRRYMNCDGSNIH